MPSRLMNSWTTISPIFISFILNRPSWSLDPNGWIAAWATTSRCGGSLMRESYGLTYARTIVPVRV
jgi:hypothetical protein